MTVATRIAVAAGIVFLTAFVFIVLAHGPWGSVSFVIGGAAIVVLVAAGSLTYGRNSPYARAQARTRPAQEAQDRAADEAADARRGGPGTASAASDLPENPPEAAPPTP